MPVIASTINSTYFDLTQTSLTNISPDKIIGAVNPCSSNLSEFDGFLTPLLDASLRQISPISFCNHFNTTSVMLGGDPVTTSEKSALTFSSFFDICSISVPEYVPICKNSTLQKQVPLNMVLTYTNFISNMSQLNGSVQFIQT
jgi:hypothetical protein